MRIMLGIPFALSKIAEAIGGEKNIDSDPIISYITTDTREALEGDLFIALKGINYDGNNFINEAIKKGCYTVSYSPGSSIICKNTKAALLYFAEYYLQNLPIILYKIAITGSVGKTTTKEFLKILLSEKYNVHATEGNHNNEIGFPLSILSAKPEAQILIMEMGMNHPGEISKMSKCLKPDLAIITNVGTAHIGNLGSRENIAKAKLEVLEGMTDGQLIIPYDEPLLKKSEQNMHFSHTNSEAELFVEKREDFLQIYHKGELFCRSSFSLKEEHHLKCLLPAIAAAILTGLIGDEMNRGILSISDVNTRQKHIDKEAYHFIADYYNASRESVLAFIKAACERMVCGKKHLLLGDILELGRFSEEIHYEIGTRISPDYFGYIFLFGSEVKHIASGAIGSGFPRERIIFNPHLSRPEITADQIKYFCQTGDTIFMKASRAIRLERVIDCFS